ncbi:MAG: SUMF1/EgtB/PvdO family nonheme iron enzyme [Betaproteobacteria bacterium]|nr:SUMF1/EgtB/PvdO family nonheme iron enzyme [Betaproteobacteria bacterium]
MNAAVEAGGLPATREAIQSALRSARKRTFEVYEGLPESYWIPARFPYLDTVNPPLWELAHIGWFAEFFGLRWRHDDREGRRVASVWEGADALLDSRIVPHRERWTRDYPPKAQLLDYMAETLERLILALDDAGEEGLARARLVLLHEDMHAEALLMTLATLNLPLPATVVRAPAGVEQGDLDFAGGTHELGAGDRAFRFDNECPPRRVDVSPFRISSGPVGAEALEAFRHSAEFGAPQWWGEDGAAWRARASDARAQQAGHAAMHVSWYEARAYCRWARRRLPSEAEWEFAATHSASFRASCGQVWEWTDSPFMPYPGFEPGVYAEYSQPWFGDHTVLRGGSFATVDRLRYPQYRNFYRPERSDMFCGFRTCAL